MVMEPVIAREVPEPRVEDPTPLICSLSTAFRMTLWSTASTPEAGCTVTVDEYVFEVSAMLVLLELFRQKTSPPVALFREVWRLLGAIVLVQFFGDRPVQFGVEP